MSDLAPNPWHGCDRRAQASSSTSSGRAFEARWQQDNKPIKFISGTISQRLGELRVKDDFQ